MSSVGAIITQYVCPSMGIVMASAMFSAPISSLKAAISQGTLGELNPTPWAFMTGNCLGWVAYAVITQDLFVLFANAPGLVLSIWLNMGAAKLQYQEMHRNYIYGCGASHSLELQLQHEDEGEHDEEITEINSGSNSEDGGNRIRSLPSFTPHEKWVIRVVTIWVLTLSVVCFVPMSRAKQSDIIGLIVNINLVIFYGAPLSTILDVLKTRNSSSIHRRTMWMSLLNSFFWFVYALTIKDIVILIPNGCGFFLGIIQLVLYIIFPNNIEISDDRNGVQQPMINNGEEENVPAQNDNMEII